ncbi:MAG: transposase [Acidobacteria bacterium]|nr:transposase [Acidobacteriota bacterium]
MATRKSSRVNSKYKTMYKIRNWREYERGLRNRGDVTIWLSEAAIGAWRPPKNGLRGGQRRYSNLAIVTALTARHSIRSGSGASREPGEPAISASAKWSTRRITSIAPAPLPPGPAQDIHRRADGKRRSRARLRFMGHPPGSRSHSGRRPAKQFRVRVFSKRPSKLSKQASAALCSLATPVGGLAGATSLCLRSCAHGTGDLAPGDEFLRLAESSQRSLDRLGGSPTSSWGPGEWISYGLRWSRSSAYSWP